MKQYSFLKLKLMRSFHSAFLISFVFCLCFVLTWASLCLMPLSAMAESYIQVMSVRNGNTAKAEAGRLETLGIPSFVRVDEAGEEVIYRVFVGPFDDDKEAVSAGRHLKTQGTIKEFVLRTESGKPVGADLPQPQIAVSSSALANVPHIGAQPETSSAADTAQAQQAGPQAAIPTYGEPVSPEMAKDLGSSVSGLAQPHGRQGEQGAAITTYGQQQAQTVKKDNAPPVKVGDTMPGLIEDKPSEAALKAEGGSLGTYGEAENKAASSVADAAAMLQPVEQGALKADVSTTMQGHTQSPGTMKSSSPEQNGLETQGRKQSPEEVEPTASQALPEPVAQLENTVKSGNKKVIPAKPTGPMKIQGFSMLVDLSSSMRRMSNCGGRIKEEAVASLLRKMNHRIPSHPYISVLRVFGYKNAVTKSDFTTTYYGPSTYGRESFESAVAKLAAADSVSPFGTAISSSSKDLSAMGNPKVVLMFSDFEESAGAGNPIKSAEQARRSHDNGITIYTFYSSRQAAAFKLAKSIASAGGGKSYDICVLLEDNNAFEEMMMEIFGPSDEPPCDDLDEDGVCDNRDECPNTPIGAPVDERGCWIAAYSQFFDFDKAVVKSAFLPRIEHAALILNKNPLLPRVIIAGHTDGVGTDAYNLELGRKRAQAVKDLLIKYGVTADRLVVESYGKSRPIADNETEEGRAKNRRVEFHIGDMPPAK